MPSAEPNLSDARSFVERHRAALENDEVRHNVLLAILGRLEADEGGKIRRWTLGDAGECAVQTPGFPIVLGELSQAQCYALAEATRELDYLGVVGGDLKAGWFATRAAALGVEFLEPIPQQIHVLREPPRYPNALGHARPVGIDDAALLFDWTVAFRHEATPHDALPERHRVEKVAAEGRHMFWLVDGAPVSMAAIARRLRNAAAIGPVYTPPPSRGRGYAGSVVGAVVERIFAEGRSAACLYADMRNPYANRCYAKLGFRPVDKSWHYPRAQPDIGSG